VKQAPLIPEEQPAEASELAYIAGLFDGEGSVSISKIKNKSGKSYSLKVKISMTNPEALKLCSRLFGKKFFPGQRAEKNHAVSYTWQLTGQRAGSFLKAIRPFLLVKAQDADIGLRFFQSYWQPKGPKSVTFQREAVGERLKAELFSLSPSSRSRSGRPKRATSPTFLTCY